MENILFYKYVEIKDRNKLKESLLNYCNSNNLKGKILLAEEGINGNLTGSIEDCEKFVEFIKKDSRFTDMAIKRGKTDEHNFKRTIVKFRDEIITTGFGVDIKNKADYIEPKELKELYESGEEFFIIDTRNDYEFELGRFKGAVELPLRNFQEFPQAVKTIEHLKDKKVVTYCTGGVRCEKASAYLKEQGFKDVMQLHGGIISYGDVVGDVHWEGKCFVFDQRGAIEIDPAKQETNYEQCKVCFIPFEEKYNCPQCGEEFIICERCHPLMDGCCSKFCRNVRRRDALKLKN